MAIRWEDKRPQEAGRLYAHDWTAFLGDDAIASSSWQATGVSVVAEEFDDTTVTVRLSGGTSGTVARLTNTVTTVGGSTELETFTLVISEFEEPVGLSDAKQHVRVPDDSEDALIVGYIRAAREWVENYTGKALVRREFTEHHIPDSTGITLYRAPLVSAAVTGFADTRTVNGRLFPLSGSSWPRLTYPDRLTATYTAGYAEGEVPQALIQAMLLLVGHFYANREGVAGGSMAEVPMAVESLCSAYRSPSL